MVKGGGFDPSIVGSSPAARANAGIAQLVEQAAVNRQVGGSSPSASATDIEEVRAMECLTITVKEAAGMLGVSLPTMYTLAKSGEFPVLRIGKSILILSEPFRKWVSQKAGVTDDAEEIVEE